MLAMLRYYSVKYLHLEQQSDLNVRILRFCLQSKDETTVGDVDTRHHSGFRTATGSLLFTVFQRC